MPLPPSLILGYQPDFMGTGLRVPLPAIQQPHPAGQSKQFDYLHFSVVASKVRKFPYFSATNINGGLFRQLDRVDNWRNDDRAVGWQWGYELYGAPKSLFDRGHMTKREDPQWGDTDNIAAQAADETFFYTNAVPQLKNLNRPLTAWQGLENYILHDEARLGGKATAIRPGLLLNVFTGPVLHPLDPHFITPVQGQHVLLPVLFWKVVYYTNDGVELRRVGFPMGQHNAMKNAGVIAPVFEKLVRTDRTLLLEDFFEDYKDAEPFQVGVRFIEEQTGMRFPAARETHPDKKPNALHYQIPTPNKVLLEHHTPSAVVFTNLDL